MAEWGESSNLETGMREDDYEHLVAVFEDVLARTVVAEVRALRNEFYELTTHEITPKYEYSHIPHQP